MTNENRLVLKKTLKISINTFFYLVIIFMMIFSLANIKVKTENDIPNIFGTGFLAVASESMKGDQADSFDRGDMIFVKMLDSQSRQQLDVGDIITYYDRSIRALNTHRIIEIMEQDGQTLLVTQGDNTPGPDMPIYLLDALAIHQTTWSGAGNALAYMQTPAGFALIVILPVIVILIYEGIILGRNILMLNKSKLEEKYALDKEEAQKAMEEEKARIRQQVLEELKKEQSESK